MKSFDLNFPSRCRLNQILNEISGPVGRLRPLLAVLDKISFSDEEWGKVRQEAAGPNSTSFIPPTPEFGVITVELEDSQAEALYQELNNLQSLKLADLKQWAGKVMDQLKGGQA